MRYEKIHCQHGHRRAYKYPKRAREDYRLHGARNPVQTQHPVNFHLLGPNQGKGNSHGNGD